MLALQESCVGRLSSLLRPEAGVHGSIPLRRTIPNIGTEGVVELQFIGLHSLCNFFKI